MTGDASIRDPSAVTIPDGFELITGEALLAFDDTMAVVGWNRAAEELTGIPAEKALGRLCWEILGATDPGGSLICHTGCSKARLAREGWPVAADQLLVRTRSGRRRVAVSTLALRHGERQFYVHLMRNGRELAAEGDEAPPRRRVTLTTRQQEVLRLVADGLSAREIARRLHLAEPTVRNHIHAILLELGSHSQLQAVARARAAGLV